MNQFDIHVTNADGVSRSVKVPFESSDSLRQLIERIEEQAQVDGRALVELALETESVDESRPLTEFNLLNKSLRVQRVCVEVHFESETKQHWFPVSAKWARVHRWACNAFHVANDACAHLELREGSPTGPAINERQDIGPSAECKVVWLVKPGPEPNG